MSREASRLLLGSARRITADLDLTLADVELLCTKDEFAAYKRMVGKVMGEALLEIINPIIRKYPELTPRGFRPPRRLKPTRRRS
jgi:hypothetical protein